jgi:hypothetical protein
MDHQVTQYKRLNFFTGFFTTADDWNDGEQYHIEKRRLHNRALHRPGILPGEGGELAVVAAGGRSVRVQEGAALDGYGNLITLPDGCVFPLSQPNAQQTVYIFIAFHEEPDGHFQNVEEPEFSGDTRMVERPQVECTLDPPDGIARIELARLYLTPENVDIKDAHNSTLPQPNEIDRTYVRYAGARGLSPARLDAQVQQRLDTAMVNLRENMAALDTRFSTPTVADVRGAALQARLLAGTLEPGQLPHTLAVVADLQQDVGEELGVRFPPLVAKPEYQAYQAAVAALLALQSRHAPPGEVIAQQETVNTTVRDLAEVVFPPPQAAAGSDQFVRTMEVTANVTLDATRSTAAAGQRIVRYIWEEIES